MEHLDATGFTARLCRDAPACEMYFAENTAFK